MLVVTSAGLVATAAVGFRLFERGGRRIVFHEIAGLAPFRSLEATGRISGESLAVIGLGDTDAPLVRRAAEARRNLCPALFRDAAEAEAVPLAFFTDVNCPNCRALEPRLEALVAERPGRVNLIRHDLPILGNASVTAARALIAAEGQDGRAKLERRLMRAGLTTDTAYVTAVAESAGLDAKRLLADMADPVIDDRLLTSAALRRLFGFVGVPAIVFGRTAALGLLPRTTLDALADLESAEWRPNCAWAV